MLLIWRPNLPRSLLACLIEVIQHLSMVNRDSLSGAPRRAGKLPIDLQYARIDPHQPKGLFQ
ncbi:MAG: alpha-E domain-containing protein [Polaromonas sp.]